LVLILKGSEILFDILIELSFVFYKKEDHIEYIMTDIERETYIDIVIIMISGLRIITYELLSHIFKRSSVEGISWSP
jgi:hypothetical protein